MLYGVSVAAGTDVLAKPAAKPLTPLPLVVSSIRPLQLIVDEIAGEFITSEVLLGASSSPHDFSLTIAQALMLADAHLLVWVGPNMERFLQSGVRAKSLVAMDHVGAADGVLDTASDVPAHTYHHHAGEDPHLWLNPQEVIVFAHRLTKSLVKILPNKQAVLEQRLQGFIAKLESRHQANQALLAPFTSRAFAVYHDAYGHLFDAYQLHQTVSLTRVPHERLSARRLNEAGQKMAGASCLLSESAEAKQAGRYAKLFDAPLITIDLLASDDRIHDFDRYLEGVGSALFRCVSQFSADEKNR